jgi:lipopolysaccharide transport system ATP-binding protein
MSLPMSCDDISLSVSNLTKTYRIFGHPGDRVKQALSFGLKKYHDEFTALKDVSFDVNKGETIGIIGRNGSGKSTLLQLICKILKPTSGTVDVRGRVSALLELGAGFNPEFTGTENVYFQGSFMGLTKAQMSDRFDDIAAFADIGDFINQPVRTYSSGMFVRLAFAVAINVDPDILIVDEALAVGDASFQSRSFRKILDFRDTGKTILFVSHNLNQISRMCDRCLLLNQGELLLVGEPKKVVGQYRRLSNAAPGTHEKISRQIQEMTSSSQNCNDNLGGGDGSYRVIDATESQGDGLCEFFDHGLSSTSIVPYESQGATIEQPKIVTEAGECVNNLFSGTRYHYVYRVHFDKSARNVRFGFMIKTPSGLELGGATSEQSTSKGLIDVPKDSIIDVDFSFDCVINTGEYYINAGVVGEVDGEDIFLHRLLDAVLFRVIESHDSCSVEMVNFGARSEIQFVDSPS